MDNFRFNMLYVGEATLKRAVELAFCKDNAASHYAVRSAEPAIENVEKPWLNRPAKARRIVFYGNPGGVADLTPFPFQMDAAGCADFAHRWLSQSDYGREPDHDGVNEKGWRVYNERGGKVDGHTGAIVAVSPAWACYGK